MSVKILDKSNFVAETQSGIALIDFYADWCGPCKMIAPIIQEIAEEQSDITVGKVNVDSSPELAAAFGVSSIPTIIVLKDGKEVNKIVGYRPKEDILAML